MRSVRGEWIKDPDRSVQDAIFRVFDLYPKLGSLGKIIGYMREHGLLFPRRIRGALKWGPVDAAMLHRVLHNPAYAGTYAFLRHPSRRRQENRTVVVKRRSRKDWIGKDDHHEAYVSRETWEQLQELLASRRPALRPLVGKGNAILQGSLRCGRCGKRLGPQYWGRDGMARTATYVCLRVNGWGDPTHRVTVPARFLDAAVAAHVLSALTAVDADSARAVVERAHMELSALERNRRRRLEDSQEETERNYRAVIDLPPGFPHAKVELLAKYEESLKRHEAVKADMPSATVPTVALAREHIDDLVRRTSNVHALWTAPQRTAEDKKRLLQSVIAEVVVKHADRERVNVELVWKGGLREQLQVLRPRGVDAFVNEQTRAGKSAHAIAEELTSMQVVTARGRQVSATLVGQKQRARGLALKDERLRARQLITEGLMANLPRPELRRQLQEQVPRLGPWDPQRLSEAIRQLRRGVSSNGNALPAILPAEAEKQRVLALVNEGLAAGQNWKAIATTLNATGIRPPRGETFTPVQIRLLYLRDRGVESFRLPAAARARKPSGS